LIRSPRSTNSRVGRLHSTGPDLAPARAARDEIREHVVRLASMLAAASQ